MSARRPTGGGQRTTQRWLHCYPASWRARYGRELEDLILATSGGGEVPWRTRFDLLRSGGAERLRNFGLGRAASPNARVRAGALITLCAFAIFLVGAAIFQRFGENWQELKGGANVQAASAAVLAMKVLAPLAVLAVLCGIVLALPATFVLIRGQGWSVVRKSVGWAVPLTVAAIASLVIVAIWAHHLSASQRNGHDTAYEIGFSAMAIVYIACLAAWTGAALALARRIELGPRLMRAHALLSTAVAVAMVAITVALGVWWATLAHAVPWVLHGLPSGAYASPVTPQLLLAGTLTACAAALGACGSAIALLGLQAARREQAPRPS